MYDDWTLNNTSSTVGRMIGRARTIQLQLDNNNMYDMWIFDAQMFTAINFAAGNNAVAVGDVLRGRHLMLEVSLLTMVVAHIVCWSKSLVTL